MTDQYDTNNDDQQNSGNGLRAQLERALAELKTLKDENGSLKTQARTTSVSTVLKDKGYSEKVAKLIPAEIEPTAEAVQKWLDEYADVFNIQQQQSSDNGNSTEDSANSGGQSGEVDFDTAEEYIATMRQMGNINGGLLPPERAKDLLAKLNDPALTQEGLLSLITQHGGGVGMG